MNSGPSEPIEFTARLSELMELWLELVEREEAAFMHCVALDGENPTRTPEKAEAVRAWWSIVNAMLWMFVRTKAQHLHDLEPFPAITLGRLANISEEISVGNIPSFVADAKKSGRGLWRQERHHIAYGILYVEAVRRGEISDHAPNQTVRRLYNVTSRAVQGWMKKRDQICIGVPHRHLSAEQLTETMKKSAATYSRIGRGAPKEN